MSKKDMCLLKNIFLDVFVAAFIVNWSKAGPYLNGTFSSVGHYICSDFHWSVGVPNVTVMANLYSLHWHGYYRIHLQSKRFSSTIGRCYANSARSYVTNVEVTCYTTGRTSQINVTIPGSTVTETQELRIREMFYSSEYVKTKLHYQNCPTKIVNFDMKESRKDWKYGNKTFIRCTDEKLMTTRTHTQFFRDTTARCKEDATWYYSDVECYQGLVVDLNKFQTSYEVNSGSFVLLFCEARSDFDGRVSISIENNTLTGSKSVWFNLSVTPEHHRVGIKCSKMLYKGIESIITSSILEVKFPPEIPGNISVTRPVAMDVKDDVAFSFASNPVLRICGYVSINKDGAEFQEYYLTGRGTLNTIIIHFEKVTNSSLGKYLVDITSCAPFNKKYHVEIDVIQSFSVDATSTDSVGLPLKDLLITAGSAVGATLLLIAGVIAILQHLHIISCQSLSGDSPTTSEEAENVKQTSCSQQYELPLPLTPNREADYYHVQSNDDVQYVNGRFAENCEGIYDNL